MDLLCLNCTNIVVELIDQQIYRLERQEHVGIDNRDLNLIKAKIDALLDLRNLFKKPGDFNGVW